MELFLLYIWLKLDAFRELLLFAGIFAISIGVIGFSIFKAWEHDICAKEDEVQVFPSWIKGMKRVIFTLVVIFGAHTLLPTSKETAYLVAGHYALKAVESPEAQKIASVLRKKANEFLDEQLKEKP